MMRRTVLGALHEARGAHWMVRQDWEIPGWFAGVEQEYDALQEGAGLVDLSHRTRLRITGRDRRSWFHGQCSQDIVGLPDGRGAYATVMDVRGHLVCDLRVYALSDSLLVDVPAGTDPPIAQYLERYLVMERCEVEDITESWAQLAVQGPHSCYVLGALLGADVCSMDPWEIRECTFEDEPIYVARVFHCGEDGFDLFVPGGHAAALWAGLCQPRVEFSVHSVGWEALNVRRVEAGIPWWGYELSPAIVPLEACLDHGVCRTKGCYVGQEIIARIDARGHVNNLLGGFYIAGSALPALGAEIHHAGKKVGLVSSAVESLALKRPVGMGFFRRELHTPGQILEAAGADGPIALEVTPLPFVPHDAPEWKPGLG